MKSILTPVALMSRVNGLTGGLSLEGSHLCHCYHHQPIRGQYSDELTNQKPVFITTGQSEAADPCGSFVSRPVPHEFGPEVDKLFRRVNL